MKVWFKLSQPNGNQNFVPFVTSLKRQVASAVATNGWTVSKNLVISGSFSTNPIHQKESGLGSISFVTFGAQRFIVKWFHSIVYPDLFLIEIMVWRWRKSYRNLNLLFGVKKNPNLGKKIKWVCSLLGKYVTETFSDLIVSSFEVTRFLGRTMPKNGPDCEALPTKLGWPRLNGGWQRFFFLYKKMAGIFFGFVACYGEKWGSSKNGSFKWTDIFFKWQ